MCLFLLMCFYDRYVSIAALGADIKIVYGVQDKSNLDIVNIAKLKEQEKAVENFCTLERYLLMYVTGNCISIMIYLCL